MTNPDFSSVTHNEKCYWEQAGERKSRIRPTCQAGKELSPVSAIWERTTTVDWTHCPYCGKPITTEPPEPERVLYEYKEGRIIQVARDDKGAPIFQQGAMYFEHIPNSTNDEWVSRQSAEKAIYGLSSGDRTFEHAKAKLDPLPPTSTVIHKITEE